MSDGLRGFLVMLLVAAASAAAFWLLTTHWAHILGIAPYLLFLACPLMHLLMHRGHKHKGHDHVRMRNDEDANAGKA